MSPLESRAIEIFPGNVGFPPIDRDQVNVTGCEIVAVMLLMKIKAVNRIALICDVFLFEFVSKLVNRCFSFHSITDTLNYL